MSLGVAWRCDMLRIRATHLHVESNDPLFGAWVKRGQKDEKPRLGRTIILCYKQGPSSGLCSPTVPLHACAWQRACAGQENHLPPTASGCSKPGVGMTTCSKLTLKTNNKKKSLRINQLHSHYPSGPRLACSQATLCGSSPPRPGRRIRSYPFEGRPSLNTKA